MAFTFKNRNIVVAGEFNRAIIRPHWLIQQKVVTDGEFEVIVSDRPEAPAVFKVGGCQWEVALHRLLVRSVDEPEYDPGPLIAKVLKILPFTPVNAVGHNFLFENQQEPQLAIQISHREPASIAPSFAARVLRTEAAVSFALEEQNRLTAKVSNEQPVERIDLNFHLMASDSETAIVAVERAQEFRTKADEVIRILAGGKP